MPQSNFNCRRPQIGSVLTCALIGVAICGGCARLDIPKSNVVSVNLNESWTAADRLNRRGVKHLNNNQSQLAENSFRRAIRTNQGHGGAHNNLGLLYYRQRKLAKAAEAFQRAIEFLPDNPSPINNLGMTLDAAGKTDQAIELYRQAYDMAPTNALFLGNLVRTKIRKGERDELVTAQLQDLLLLDHRCDWVDWAKEQLAIDLNPYLDRGPAQATKLSEPDSTDSERAQIPIADMSLHAPTRHEPIVPHQNATGQNTTDVRITDQAIEDQSYRVRGESILAGPDDYSPSLPPAAILDTMPPSDSFDVPLTSPITRSMPADTMAFPPMKMPPMQMPQVIQQQSATMPIQEPADSPLVSVEVDHLDR